ncbi:MAG: sigma-70 family polymerase sigma factor [Microbacteriaceae bacterium]|nr:sigma-70 family polymerase sigma factor [Microbacteriaceae bacterium]
MSLATFAIDLDQLSDPELAELVRTTPDPSAAFAVLWRRHSGAGKTIARRYIRLAEPDDVVAEAFARIFSAIKRGKGPTGAFRPYMAAAIGNIAKRWYSQQLHVEATDELDLAAGGLSTDASDRELDGEIAIAAFKKLPERWQQVLWHSEVEGLGPSELAPILGINANAVAALSHRARGALRVAFIELHMETATSAACASARSSLASSAAGKISVTSAAKLAAHLATCAACRNVDLDVKKLLPGLAGAVFPLLILGSFIPKLTATSTTVAAGVTPIAIVTAKLAMPAVFVPLIAAAASVAIIVGVAIASPAPEVIAARPAVVQVDEPREAPPEEKPGTGPEVVTPPPVVPNTPPEPEPEHTTEPEVLPPAPEPQEPPAPELQEPPAPVALGSPVLLSSPPTNLMPGTPLNGTGTPGATVTVDDARGIPITTTLVGEDGNWSAVLSPLSLTISSIEVRQYDAEHPVSEPTVLTGFAPTVGTPWVEGLESTLVRFGGTVGATVLINEVRLDCVDSCQRRTATMVIPSYGWEWIDENMAEPGTFRMTFTYIDEYGTSAGSQSFDFVV